MNQDKIKKLSNEINIKDVKLLELSLSDVAPKIKFTKNQIERIRRIKELRNAN